MAEGIELQTLKAPAAIDVDENNHVKGIYVTPQMVSTIKNGRASVRPTGEDDIYIPCDVLVVAIGQNIETAHFEAAGIPVSRGKILTTSTGAVEDMPDVYAGGDCSSGPATVIKAIAAAKVVAANIDEYLGFRHEISCDVEIPEAKLEDKIPCGRIDLTERAAWGEELGLSREEATVGKIIDVWRRLGADYVFDTSFSADLTIMEEGTEFLQRFTSGELKDRPMFTSCCPGWIRFIKSQYPHLVKYLSSAKSPQQMFGAVMKTYFAEKLGVSPEKIYTVSVMPCVAKKSEREMDLYYGEYAGHDVDAVVTTRELLRMIRAAHIEPTTLVDQESDRPMQEGTGAGVIFGATGGVMEAALRTAYYLLKGENPPADAFQAVRSTGFNEHDGVQEAVFQVDDVTVRTAAVSGLGNARALIDKIERGEAQYDFVEVMACPGGCVGGGGQPIHDGEELAFERGKNLYYLDKNADIRYSHENQDVQKLYEEYFEKPNSHKSHMLLHTEHMKNK